MASRWFYKIYRGKCFVFNFSSNNKIVYSADTIFDIMDFIFWEIIFQYAECCCQDTNPLFMQHDVTLFQLLQI